LSIVINTIQKQIKVHSLSMIDNVKYPVFSEGISEVLQRASMNANQVSKRLGEDPALIHKVVKGKQSASTRICLLLLTLPELVEAGLTKEKMNTWKAKDKFPEQTLLGAKKEEENTLHLMQVVHSCFEELSKREKRTRKKECPSCGTSIRVTMEELEDSFGEIKCPDCDEVLQIDISKYLIQQSQTLEKIHQLMLEQSPEGLKEFVRSKMHVLKEFREIEKEAKDKR